LNRHLAAAWASWEQAQAHGPFDIIEATDYGLLMVPPLLTGSTPVVVQMHGSIGQIQSFDPAIGEELAGAVSLAIETESVRLASSCQTYSAANQQYWSRIAGESPIELIPPAWERGGLEHKRSEIRPVISVFGRIQMWKGPKVLSEALRLLPDCPVVHWYGRDLVDSATGTGSTSQKLMEMYPEIWRNRIVTNQPVPPDTVLALQATSQVNLIPSTWDVFNFTVIEAMASGRPVVCSDCAGASALIEDGVTGFIYDGKSPQALASALRRAIDLSPEESISMGNRAQFKVYSHLDPSKIAEERMAAYRRAISGGKPSVRVPEWLAQLANPRENMRSTYSFLHRLPVQPIIEHLLLRVRHRLLGQ
jgi:glycosyltransferase involved in cell wall biosynthesis